MGVAILPPPPFKATLSMNPVGTGQGRPIPRTSVTTGRTVLLMLIEVHEQIAQGSLKELKTMGYYVADARPENDMARMINELAEEVHIANERWWKDLITGEPIERNFGELIALCHSELSEALEGDRKNLPDDKLPHRSMVEVELADALIRILDTGHGLGLDLGGAMAEKMLYNAVREDHTNEHRNTEHGKKY